MHLGSMSRLIGQQADSLISIILCFIKQMYSASVDPKRSDNLLKLKKCNAVCVFFYNFILIFFSAKKTGFLYQPSTQPCKGKTEHGSSGSM